MGSDDLRQFLQKKGAVELIFAIDKENGSIQNEIEEKIAISEPILSGRLSEAVDLGLVEITRHHDDHGNANRYQLAKRGMKLHREFKKRGLISKYTEKLELQSDLNEGIRDVLQNIDDILELDSESIHPDWTDTETITEEDIADDLDATEISENIAQSDADLSERRE